MRQINFDDCTIIQALKRLLSHVRLPSNSKMPNILHSFAVRFWDQPYTIKEQMISVNSVASLAFTIITLDQNLYDGIDQRKGIDQFLTENIGLNDGENFEEAFLVEIYSIIARQSIRTIFGKQSRFIFENPDTADFLEIKKQGVWVQRYYIYSENCLYFFSENEPHIPYGYIPLEHVSRIQKGKDAFQLRSVDKTVLIHVLKIAPNGDYKIKHKKELTFRSPKVEMWIEAIPGKM